VQTVTRIDNELSSIDAPLATGDAAVAQETN
jgi:hypothetical protein